MSPIDYSIVAVYFAFVLWAGWRYRQRNRTMDDFLLGGRSMRSLPVALSLFVSWFSVISYTAIPGELIQYGPMIWSGLLAAPLGLWFVGWVVIPRLRTRSHFYQMTSVYENIKWLFGESTARLASTLFLLMRIAWMAMVVYIASTVIVAPIVALRPWLVATVLIGVTVAYSLGGFRAVVLTDCIQAGIMFGGAIAVIAMLCSSLDVSPWPTEWPASWPVPSARMDVWERADVLCAMLGAFCLGVSVKTGDQMNVQRFLAVPNIQASRRVLLLGFGFDILLTGLLALVGLSLLASHGAVPDADGVLPHFVASGLPFGITGLVVAALLAAAMSSVSSGLNACVSTVAVDWCGDKRRPIRPTSSGDSGVASGIRPIPATVVLGIIVFILSQVIGLIEGNLIELCYKVVNLLATPLGGLVLTALFIPRAKLVDVWLGCFLCLAVVVYVTYLSPITFLLASPLGLVVQLTISSLGGIRNANY